MKVQVNTKLAFERHEKKYMITDEQYDKLLSFLEPETRKDEYGLHTICSVYYDTEDYAFIRHSLDKPVFKEKLRLRSYGVPRMDSTVYMELKKKLAGVTYKHRIPMTLREAEAYLQSGIQPQGLEPVVALGEFDWFLNRYHPIAKILLCYDRIAFLGKENSDLRITFDTDIRWRNYNLSLSEGDQGCPLLDSGKLLMEIKTQGALPLWLAHRLSELAVYPISFSKYGTVYQEQLEFKGGIQYAG